MEEPLMNPLYFLPQMLPALKRGSGEEVQFILWQEGKFQSCFSPEPAGRFWNLQGELTEWTLDRRLYLQHSCGRKETPLERVEGNMLSWACFVAAEDNGKCSTDYWIRKRGIFFHSFYKSFSSK